ncbi:30S ribosomal protein S13 [Candidatus Woesearchaeota archaeon]|nr:30S ribosomal protein S13 [Candidatus Woesearchaeota archaeon]
MEQQQEKKPDQQHHKRPEAPVPVLKPGVKHVMRIANTDLKGDKAIFVALRGIKGVGAAYAQTTCALAGVNPTKKAGSLNEQEVQKLTDVLMHPAAYHVPVWFMNRRHDYTDGEDKHLLLSDLEFVHDNDIKRLRMIKTYRGFRHAAGLPSRGQRTKSNFRRNKGNVMGVQRKKVAAPAAGAKEKDSGGKGKGK